MDVGRIARAIVDLDDEAAKTLVREALADRVAPRRILEQGLISGMREVGRRFSCEEYFVPEVLIAAEAFYAGFDLIKDRLKDEGVPSRGKVVIGTVKGDIHDIGKNIVKVMMDAAGYQVIDLGRDIPAERFVEAVQREQPAVLALSSLMTTTMSEMKRTIDLLKTTGLRDRVKVIVGGAPLNRVFAERIGADAYGEDAGQAVSIVEELLGR